MRKVYLTLYVLLNFTLVACSAKISPGAGNELQGNNNSGGGNNYQGGGEPYGGGGESWVKLATSFTLFQEAGRLVQEDMGFREDICRPCADNDPREHCAIIASANRFQRALASQVAVLLVTQLRDMMLQGQFTLDQLKQFMEVRQGEIYFQGRPVLGMLVNDNGNKKMVFSDQRLLSASQSFITTTLIHELGHWFPTIRTAPLTDDEPIALLEGGGFMRGSDVLTLAGACITGFRETFFATPAEGVVRKTYQGDNASCFNFFSHDAVRARLNLDISVDIARLRRRCKSTFTVVATPDIVCVGAPLFSGLKDTFSLDRSYTCR